MGVTQQPWQLFAGIFTGDTDGGIYRLDSPSGNWEPMNAGAPSGLWTIPTAAWASQLNGALLAGFSKGGAAVPVEQVGIYQWYAAGNSWQKIADELRGAEVTMLAQHPDCADQVFVGTNGGGLELIQLGE